MQLLYCHTGGIIALRVPAMRFHGFPFLRVLQLDAALARLCRLELVRLGLACAANSPGSARPHHQRGHIGGMLLSFSEPDNLQLQKQRLHFRAVSGKVSLTVA